MKWDDQGDFGETDELMDLVINGWSWEWPGWKWVAHRLNDEFGNNRSASACRNKFNQIEKESNK